MHTWRYLPWLTALWLALALGKGGLAGDGDADHWLDDFVEERPLFNDAGFRSRRYRAPTPDAISDAQVLTTLELQALLRREPDVVLLNVLPLTQSDSRFVLTKKYEQIAGSTWLPNVGLGTIASSVERWYFWHLQRLTRGSKAHPVVIYCQADCWMSWNAIKRAANNGYNRLYWYRNGMDGWREHALPVVDAVPQPLPREG